MEHIFASFFKIRLAVNKRMPFSQATATDFETQLVFVFWVTVPAYTPRVAQIALT
jgi:hypothetical protein